MLMLLTKPYVLCCWVPVNKREVVRNAAALLQNATSLSE